MSQVVTGAMNNALNGAVRNAKTLAEQGDLLEARQEVSSVIVRYDNYCAERGLDRHASSYANAVDYKFKLESLIEWAE